MTETAAKRVLLPTLETPTLTKAELAELLFERLGLNKRESKDMVEAFFEPVRWRWCASGANERSESMAKAKKTPPLPR